VPIPVVCPMCGQSGNVADSLAGSYIKCPKCDTQFAVRVASPASAPAAAPRAARQPGPAATSASPPAPAEGSNNTALVGALAACGGALVVLLGLVVYLVAFRDRPAAAPTHVAGALDSRALTSTAPLVPVQPQPAPPDQAKAQPEPAEPEAPQSTETNGRPQLSTEEIAAKSESGVALIRGRLSSGTGFLVGPGLIATNAHVVEDEFINNLKVRFPSAEEADQGPLDARLLYEDPKRDLAFLEVKTTLEPLEVASAYTFRRGQDITIIGNPGLSGELTLENAISKGVMSTKTKIDGLDFYQLSIAINPGNSGGPVIDSTGQVIGVATLKASKQEGLAFCVPVEDLQQAMQRVSKLKRADIDEAAAQHRLSLVLRLLSASSGLYVAVLDQYSEVANVAARRGGNVGPVLQQAARLFTEKLKPFDENLFVDLETEVFQTASDPRTAPESKQPLLQLWSAASEMKQLVNRPPLDFSAFRSRLTELRAKYRQAIVSLKRSLSPELAAHIKDAPADIKRPLPFARAEAEPVLADVSQWELTVVDLSFRPETRAGYVKVSGKLKNSSQQPITNAVATIVVRDDGGLIRSRIKVPLVPATIAPGGSATFFTRVKFYSSKDRYKVEFATTRGQKIAAISSN
jgi:S1-C subfamily serine protease